MIGIVAGITMIPTVTALRLMADRNCGDAGNHGNYDHAI
jgi:hypothetical protein